MNPPNHIGQSVSFKMQKLEWKHIPPEQVISLEIINWNKIQNVPYQRTSKNETWYCLFVAKLHSNLPNIAEAGHLLIFNIPYRTFDRSIAALSFFKKEFITKNHDKDFNVLITMKKNNKCNLIITEFKQMELDEFLSMEANEIMYSEFEKAEEDG